MVVAALLTAFRSWEPGDETWPYWFWARMLRETGRFIVPDRSPLYTLYLNAYAWLPYPSAIVAEYLASMALVGLAAVAFARRWLGTRLAVIAAVAWMPFLQAAEPPVQRYALAASLVAAVLRFRSTERRWTALSYALLIVAYLFRSTWLVLLVAVAVYDLWRALRSSGLSGLARRLTPRPRTDWPLLVPVLALATFLALQSPHPWNNIFSSSSTWFPSRVTSFTNGSFLAVFNAVYAQQTYGEDRDWYFTDREVFAGADDMVAAIRANPTFVLRQVVPFTLAGVRVAASESVIDPLLSWVPGGVAVEAVLLGALAYGAVRAAGATALRPFVVGYLFMIGLTVLAGPRPRYMVPLVPVFLLAAAHYGRALGALLDRVPELALRVRRPAAVAGAILVTAYVVYLASRLAAGRYVPVGPVSAAILALVGYAAVTTLARPRGALARALARAAMPLAVVLLSPGLVIPVPGATTTSWESVLGDLGARARAGDLRVLQDEPFSVTAAEPRLAALLPRCDGIMALEHRFIGAFVGVPIDRLRDIWEIPPFGQLGDPAYDGLRPSRVDCVVVSQFLTTSVGSATNAKVRYDGYVRPYVERLLAEGATSYEIPRFGTVVVARR